MLTDEERKARRSESSHRYRLTHRERMRAYAAKWRLEHPEQVYAAKRAWYEKHSEQERARQRAWQQAHPEQVRAAGRACAARRRLEHPGLVRALERARRLAHPEAQALSESRRRARKKSLPNTLTLSEWQAVCAAYKNRCAYCGRKAKLTMDHVLPLSKGGGTIAHNIVPACLSCNSAKGARPPQKPVRLTLGL